MEAKLILIASDSEEASWLRELFSEMVMSNKPILPVLINCDSIPQYVEFTINTILGNQDTLGGNTVL